MSHASDPHEVELQSRAEVGTVGIKRKEKGKEKVQINRFFLQLFNARIKIINEFYCMLLLWVKSISSPMKE